MGTKFSQKLWFLLIVCIFVHQVNCRHSGGSSGTGRGSSSSRGESPSNHGFSGITSNKHESNIGQRNYGAYSGQTANRGGGFFGSNRNNERNRGSGFSNIKSSSGRGFGSTFKNVIVGAAAGYLAYQGGKYLIQNAIAPMMYNNRPYYWGPDNYQSRPNTQMCRMPIDPSDPQMGNIFFKDQTRPKEIVWGCNMNERCCGNDCCPNTGGMSIGNGMGAVGSGISGGVKLPANCDVKSGFDISLRPAQSVGVTGRLTCNGMPASNVLVKLYDHDTFTFDDLIKKGTTDGQGYFCIAGYANEISKITPKLNVYHNCNNNNWLCKIKIPRYIPTQFVLEGRIPHTVYDAGTTELSRKYPDQSIDCFH